MLCLWQINMLAENTFERNIATFRLDEGGYDLADVVEAVILIRTSYNIGTKISLNEVIKCLR